MKIIDITAREILDSRGNPTVAATVYLKDGIMAEASVPSGASTGSSEAVELRDKNKNRFSGMGVLSAVENVNKIISPALTGQDAKDQVKIDCILCELDGTAGKENLGANATLAVSMAVARAQAVSDGLELYEYLAVKYRGSFGRKFTVPTPMFNVLNGGKHADNQVDIQEAMIVPAGISSFKAKVQAGSEIYHTLRNILVSDGYNTGLGDEGGFAPDFPKNEYIFKYLTEAVSESGYSQIKVRIAVDVAASSFYDKKNGCYEIKNDAKKIDSNKMIALLAMWVKKYHILSVEDGLWESDEHWADLTKAIKPAFSIGDDLLTTHTAKIKIAAKEKQANGVIIKPNQVGTVTETLRAIKEAQKNKFKVIVSHRSGETEDSFIADLAVAVGADYIKSGAPARSERLAKYNRLLKIEELIGNKKK